MAETPIKKEEQCLIPFMHYADTEVLKPKFVESEKKRMNIPDEWYALEKVDGCNVAFSCDDGQRVQMQKRNSHLPMDAKFHGVQQVYNAVAPMVREVYTCIKDLMKDKKGPACAYTNVMHVFGELFGGIYPNMKPSASAPVQKRIFYCPDVRFYAFDVAWEGKFLDWDDVEPILSSHGFFTAKAMHRGTLQQMIELPYVFESTIPVRLGLPPVKNNNAEGWVIKRVHEAGPRHVYPAYKYKNPLFSEIKTAAATAPVDIKTLEAEMGEVALHEKALESYMTMSRLISVISKECDVCRKDLPRINGLLVRDALKDYEKSLDSGRKINPAVLKRVTGALFRDAKRLTDEWWSADHKDAPHSS